MAAFFHFCRVRKWIVENPVLSIKLPEVTPAPTLPFEPDQFEKILAACDEYPIKGIHAQGNRTRLKAMVLLLRYTGLRIRDGVTITRPLGHDEDGVSCDLTQKPLFPWAARKACTG